MSMLLRMLLKCSCVEKIILCNNGAEYPVHPHIRSEKIEVRDLSENAYPSHRFVMAHEENAQWFFFMDDDLLLTPEQVHALFSAALSDSSCVHGMCGEQVEEGGIRHYLHGEERDVSILNRAYACSANHIHMYHSLLADLSQSYKSEAHFRDDILLSMSGEHAPRCHDVGTFLSCPTSVQQGVAVSCDDSFTDSARLDFYGHVSLVKETRCVSDDDVRYLCGHASLHTADTDLVVTCLMRDAELTIVSFIEHYLALGAAHIVLLDNGSTDRTVELASSYENVYVFRCTLPFAQYQLPMKRWLARKFCTGCWCLSADSDELFLHPDAETVSLSDFLKHLRSKQCGAVAAHMLDMFSDCPLQEVRSTPKDNIKEAYPYYDLKDVHAVPQDAREKLTSNSGLRCLYGGIRKSLFGSRHFLLTKTPLFFVDDAIRIFPQNEHFVEQVRIADCTGVLLHYKFVGSFREKAEDAVRRKNHWSNSAEYKLYLRHINDQPHLSPMSSTAQKWKSTHQIAEEGFIELFSQGAVSS